MSADFDAYASNYEKILAKSLSITGETGEYFSKQRIRITRRLIDLHRLHRLSKIVDFGCGPGIAIPFLIREFQPHSVVGVDISPQILAEATQRNHSGIVGFCHPKEYSGYADLVFCNGVFHHIAPGDRGAALHFVHRVLRPGAIFALWENNPLNPGTRLVMSRCEFDRGTFTMTPGEARKMLKLAGFDVIRVTSAFFFPRLLAWLRHLEPSLAPTMLGGQYLILSRPAAK
ncbi:MAG: methyltransferase domain-containing protein [Verrucomicrobia bacterium]|nr:methyltransferase domain-containing protein [Verrucomicrobiota bacterium]